MGKGGIEAEVLQKQEGEAQASTPAMPDLGSIPGLDRSPGEEKDYPLQYSGLENSKDCPWGCKELDTTE